jgi:hypothetical protein
MIKRWNIIIGASQGQNRYENCCCAVICRWNDLYHFLLNDVFNPVRHWNWNDVALYDMLILAWWINVTLLSIILSFLRCWAFINNTSCTKYISEDIRISMGL